LSASSSRSISYPADAVRYGRGGASHSPLRCAANPPTYSYTSSLCAVGYRRETVSLSTPQCADVFSTPAMYSVYSRRIDQTKVYKFRFCSLPLRYSSSYTPNTHGPLHTHHASQLSNVTFYRHRNIYSVASLNPTLPQECLTPWLRTITLCATPLHSTPDSMLAPMNSNASL
jgi:hypothetical protein